MWNWSTCGGWWERRLSTRCLPEVYQRHHHHHHRHHHHLEREELVDKMLAGRPSCSVEVAFCRPSWSELLFRWSELFSEPELLILGDSTIPPSASTDTNMSSSLSCFFIITPISLGQVSNILSDSSIYSKSAAVWGVHFPTSSKMLPICGFDYVTESGSPVVNPGEGMPLASLDQKVRRL